MKSAVNGEPTILLELPLSYVNYGLQLASREPHAEADPFIVEVKGQVKAQLAAADDAALSAIRKEVVAELAAAKAAEESVAAE